jgi:hypothetical protein
MWDKILGAIVNIPQAVADVYKQRQEIKHKEQIRKIELEEAIHQRKVELIKQGLHADANWEIEQIRASGWKDEWVLIVISIPLIMCFMPFLAPYVVAGFAALNDTPQWYQWLVLLIFTAVYGIRIWRRQQSDT